MKYHIKRNSVWYVTTMIINEHSTHMNIFNDSSVALVIGITNKQRT